MLPLMRGVCASQWHVYFRLFYLFEERIPISGGDKEVCFGATKPQVELN